MVVVSRGRGIPSLPHSVELGIWFGIFIGIWIGNSWGGHFGKIWFRKINGTIVLTTPYQSSPVEVTEAGEF